MSRNSYDALCKTCGKSITVIIGNLQLCADCLKEERKKRKEKEKKRA